MNAPAKINTTKGETDMATALAPETGASTDIVIAVTQNPGLVLLDRQQFDAFYARMKAETDKLVPDTSTAKGRDEIRSMAARVRSSKAAIDKARLTLTKDWRDKVSMANEAGKVIETELEQLAVEVRAPLTEWEEAEKARVARGQALIAEFKAAATVTLEDTAATVRQRGMDVWNTAIDADDIGDDLFAEASAAKQATVVALKTALVRLEKEEADRAELERLREEAAERERVEAEKRAEAERAEREAEEARIAEERRAAAEQAEADRIANAEREAAARAQREAAEAAEAERQRVQAQHDAALAAERRRAEEAEAAAQAERDRVAREKAEADRRAADQEHRTQVKTAAKEAMMSCGADEETARKIVISILANEIPNVKLEF